MNEKTCKNIVIGTILCFLLLLFAQSVVDGAAFRRANTEIDALTRELNDARTRVENCSRELEDCRGTFEKCYSSVGRIADSINGQSDDLSGIIENLRTVREEVKIMENSLTFFYIKYGYNDNDYNNNGGELE